jgi:hypothetical protein
MNVSLLCIGKVSGVIEKSVFDRIISGRLFLRRVKATAAEDENISLTDN